MRFGRLRSLLALVPLLVFPAGTSAAPAPLPATEETVEALSADAEHALLSLEGTQEKREEGEKEPSKPSGRPKVVSIALRYLGIPYRWAGASPSGFDCSGFVMYVYGRVGVALPHNGAMLWNQGRFVARNRLAPGDVVFFNGLGHVGIYMGRGRFVHSPHSGDVVKISRLSEGSYRSSYVGARRYR
jgi:cell wall-associated NlpC family hydrolase